jgi:short-subunit dehydrogenase involved in D-alanine esterification of teichoic acids
MPQSKPLPYECVLITGGGGGIGKAMARYFIQQGKKVLIAGRTESKLQSTAKEIGAAGFYVLDTGDVPAIPEFIARITKEHPDLDCLVNNAGVQRPLRVMQDNTAEFLAKADNEIDINIRGPVHLSVGLLPHFRKLACQGRASMIINVSSVLGFVPFSGMNPIYNGTKAFLHFWTMNLRSQLEQDEDVRHKIRVVEIAPPTVETDLHREREDPDDNKKGKNKTAMSLDEFMDEAARNLEAGEDVIAPGPAHEIVGKWMETIGPMYKQMIT